MNTAMPFPWPGPADAEHAETSFHVFFEHAPMAVARCNSEGVIVEMNPAFERRLNREEGSKSSLRFCELVHPQDRAKTDLLLRDVLDSRRDAIGMEAFSTEYSAASAKLIAWRQAGRLGEPDHALLIDLLLIDERMREPIPSSFPGEGLLQTQKWEAIGRLAGGVVHDFNNLLTGVTLYCDLLLSSFDEHDRRRRYADEIRSAIVQASDLVRQLLLCARPQAVAPGLLSFNEIAEAMRDLLTRLIGDNIILELRLDPELGAIKIDRAQAQQVLLNLVLNARDALPKGGRITVETSNCAFRPMAGTSSQSLLSTFPCILLMVADNGHGMNSEIRRRLSEPFFTTKAATESGGLGLTTVRGIVTTNHGLIHFESEAGCGTRAMVLFPRSVPADPEPLRTDNLDSDVEPLTTFQEIKKESLI